MLCGKVDQNIVGKMSVGEMAFDQKSPDPNFCQSAFDKEKVAI
jgi:hypothetical protein